MASTTKRCLSHPILYRVAIPVRVQITAIMTMIILNIPAASTFRLTMTRSFRWHGASSVLKDAI